MIITKPKCKKGNNTKLHKMLILRNHGCRGVSGQVDLDHH